jgi:hypothetical protein
VIGLPPLEAGGVHDTLAELLPPVATTPVGAPGAVPVGAVDSTLTVIGKLLVTNTPPAMAQLVPGGGATARPVQPWATTVLVLAPVRLGVPVNVTSMTAPGSRLPVAVVQLNAPVLVFAHRSALPPGPSGMPIDIPVGGVSPSEMLLTGSEVVLVTVIEYVSG